MKIIYFLIMFFGYFILHGQNANWGSGLPINVSINGSSLNLSVYDPSINLTKTTTLYVGSNPVFKNVDGVVVGYGNQNQMYYATYDMDLKTWKSYSSYIGSAGVISTSNGVVVGYGDQNQMYYATYDVVLQTWKSYSSYIGSTGIISTSDGVVVGYGNQNQMYYAIYDVKLQTWKTYSSYLGSAGVISTSNGVVIGYGDQSQMYYATYDIELQTWKTYSSYIGSAGIISTSDGIIAGYGNQNQLFYAIYDFNLKSWKSSSIYLGSNGGFEISSGTISYYGSSSGTGTKGYNNSSSNWNNSPTTPACKLLPVSNTSSSWVFMRCMSMGASMYTYSCGDGHQISRRQGWKRYNNGLYNIELNTSNSIYNSNCNTSVAISAGASSCVNTNEPNETQNTAKTISINTDVTGQIASTTDNDYLKFTTTSTGDVTVSLTNLPANYNLKVFNTVGTQLGISQNTGTSSESISLSNLAAGTYIAYVYGYSGAYSNSSCYTLKVSTSIGTTCSNSNEPNETRPTAKTISINTDIKGQIASATDKDYLKFTTTTTGNVTLSLTTLPADYDLKVYNSSGTQIGSSLNSGTTSESISLTNLAAGTYVAYIYGYSGAFSSSNCYTFKVSTGAIMKIGSEENTQTDETNVDLTKIATGEMSLFPNPAQDQITLLYSHYQEELSQLKIIDHLGRIVQTLNLGLQHGDNTYQINVAGLARGVYLALLEGKGWKKTQRLVLE